MSWRVCECGSLSRRLISTERNGVLCGRCGGWWLLPAAREVRPPAAPASASTIPEYPGEGRVP